MDDALVVHEPSRYETLVVLRTTSVTKLDRDVTGNLSPWYGLPAESDLVVSNSCGFADYTYVTVKPERYDEYLNGTYDLGPHSEVKARGQLGEWCALSPYLFESPTIVTIGFWKDVPHILWSAEIHSDTHDSEYIVDPEYIENASLEEYLVEIEEPSEATSCWELSEISADELSWIRRHDDIQTFGELVCYTKGIYLESIADAP